MLSPPERPDRLRCPPSRKLCGCLSSFSEVKWPERDDRSPVSTAKVKNARSYNSVPPYSFMTRTGNICFVCVCVCVRLHVDGGTGIVFFVFWNMSRKARGPGGSSEGRNNMNTRKLNLINDVT
jgi:hypothetical protein